MVELPRWLWLPILHGIILRVRPRASAKKYAAIWTPEGSPLAVLERGAAPRARRSAERTTGASGAGHALHRRRAGGRGHRRIARRGRAANRGDSDVSAVLRCLDRRRVRPGGRGAECRASCARAAIRVRLPRTIRRTSKRWRPACRSIGAQHGATHHLLMSFHGVPERFVTQGDPYRVQCERTAELLAQKLGLAAAQWSVSFQSRFGRARWLQPYTSEVLAEAAGARRQERERDLPGLRGRLPRDAGGNRHGESRRVPAPRAARPITTFAALNARPDHVGRVASRGAGRARERRRTACSQERRHALAEGLSRDRRGELVRGAAVPAAAVRLSRADTGREHRRRRWATRASRSWSASCSAS